MFQWESYVSLGVLLLLVLIIVLIVPRSVFTKSSSIKLYKEDKRSLFNSDPGPLLNKNSKCPVTFLAPNVGPGAPNVNNKVETSRIIKSTKNYQLICQNIHDTV